MSLLGLQDVFARELYFLLLLVLLISAYFLLRSGGANEDHKTTSFPSKIGRTKDNSVCKNHA